MSGKARGYAHDVDAWVQFHLLRLASFHAETTKADVAVLAEIIQRYWGKFGNGWVTHEHLGSVAGVSKATVIRAKRNLERLGFITVLQAGRRGSATVYLPNFGLVPAKGSKDDTETLGVTDATETDGIGVNAATVTPEKGVADETPSYLQDRPTRAESQIDRLECATPLAPLADGLAATAARTAQDGFDRLWSEYGHRQRKADARTAFDKLAPSPELLEQMVAAAAAWRTAWGAQGKADAPRKCLHTWIHAELYDCDPPVAFRATRTSPSAITRRGYMPPTRVEVIDAAVTGERSTVSLVLQSPSGTGKPVEISFDLVGLDGASNDAGQKALEALVDAVGLSKVDDTDELLFRPLMLSRVGGQYMFATAANDNEAGPPHARSRDAESATRH